MMVFLYIICLAFSIPSFVFSHVLVHPSPLIQVEVGENAQLQCRFQSPIDGCYWLKDDGLIEIENRYEYLGDLNEGNCSIVIYDVKPEDAGQWVCGAPQTSSGGRGSKSNRNQLIVFVPPKPIISFNGVALDNGQKIYLLNEAEVKKLMCSVTAAIEPSKLSLKWLIGHERKEYVATPQLKTNFKDKISSVVFLHSPEKVYKATANRLTCQVTVLASGKKYETFIRIVK